MLENHFLAQGLDGFNYAGKPWPTCGEGLLRDLRRLENALAGRATLSGREFAAALFEYLSSRKTRETLETWRARADAEARPGESAAHRQAWEGLLDLLDALASTLGEETLAPQEWSELFSLGFSDLQCALVPPSLDQVLVGSIERSRHPELRAVFFVGTLEGTLPKPPGPGGFFTDSERVRLSQLDCDVGPHASRLLAEEDYLAYIAFTRPSRRLILTYPTHNAKGGETVRSRWIEWVLRRVPDAQQTPDRGALDLFPRQRLGRCLRVLRDGDETLAAPALARLAGLLRHPETRALAQRAVQGLWHHDQAVLPPTLLSQLGLNAGDVATTALEDYGKCPFLFYAQRRLRLRERRAFEVDPLELGRLQHQLLEDYGRRVIERGGDWSTLTDDELGAGLVTALEAAAAQSEAGALWLDVPRNRFQLTTTARRLARVLDFFRQESRCTGFRTRAVELAFGGEDHPAVALPLEGGGELHIAGKIDRLDASGDVLRVVDYKNTGPRFHAELARRGVSLQLPAYALAAGQLAPEAQLGGAFFMSLTPDAPPKVGPRGRPAAAAPDFKLRGLLDLGLAARMDPGLAPQESSRFVQLRRNKDGSPSARSEAMATPDLHAMLSEVREVMARLAREAAGGCIVPRPENLKSGSSRPQRYCAHCAYAAVCRYDRYEDFCAEDEPEGDEEENQA